VLEGRLHRKDPFGHRTHTVSLAVLRRTKRKQPNAGQASRRKLATLSEQHKEGDDHDSQPDKR